MLVFRKRAVPLSGTDRLSFKLSRFELLKRLDLPLPNFGEWYDQNTRNRETNSKVHEIKIQIYGCSRTHAHLQYMTMSG